VFLGARLRTSIEVAKEKNLIPDERGFCRPLPAPVFQTYQTMKTNKGSEQRKREIVYVEIQRREIRKIERV